VDVRIVAATNQDLRAALEEGTFRKDLYYRLNVVPINIPPLRERREDIPYLVDYFIERFTRESGKPIRGITPAAQKMLMEFHWPGNVREVENIIERGVALSAGDTLDVHDVRLDLSPARGVPAVTGTAFPAEGVTLEQFEDGIIQEALRRSNGNKSQAARLLGISRNALRYRLSKIGVPDEEDSKQ
jgi:transcriptional regulator with PAS, ATPase and Fis domain